MNPTRYTPVLVLLIVAIFSLSTTSAMQEANATPEARTEAQQLLHDASERLAETETMRFSLEIDGDTFIDEAQDLRLIAARGDLARPNSVDVEFQVELLGTQTVSIRMITIGDESWTTDLLTGEWAPSPEEFGYNPSVLFDNQEGLGPVAGRLVDPMIEGEEQLQDRDAIRVHGTVGEAVIDPLTSGAIEGDDIGITLWVDAETHDILRLEVAEPDDIEKDNPATWTMNLSGHNSDVNIERPDLDE